MRRVRPLVEVDGKEREMEFLTNNLCWSASSLYRCRWQIEVFFKQIKQSLQFAISTGYSANALRWQVWTALLRNSEDCFDIPNKRAPSSLPPRAERLDACLVLGYKFRYRKSILLIFRKRKLQLLHPYRSMGGQKLELPLTEYYRSLTRRWTSLNHKQ
jgi:hypothetical protein